MDNIYDRYILTNAKEKTNLIINHMNTHKGDIILTIDYINNLVKDKELIMKYKLIHNNNSNLNTSVFNKIDIINDIEINYNTIDEWKIDSIISLLDSSKEKYNQNNLILILILIEKFILIQDIEQYQICLDNSNEIEVDNIQNLLINNYNNDNMKLLINSFLNEKIKLLTMVESRLYKQIKN